MDDQSDWQRQLLIGLLVLVVVGALVGGVVAVVTIKAADLAGIDDTKATGQGHRPGGGGSGPTDTSDTSDSTNSPSGPTSSDTSGPTDTGTSSSTSGQPPHGGGIALVADPLSVAPSQRINLTGTYAAPTGTLLQVQRREGGAWVDFPVTLTVNNGEFATYILTGHTGPNVLRLLDVAADKPSNTVTVQVS